MLLFINISGRLVMINASIIIKRRKNKQIKIESMTAFVFISGIHRTNGSDNEQYSGNLIRCLPRQRERHACGNPPPPVCWGLFDLYRYTMRRSSSWTMTCRFINFYKVLNALISNISFKCRLEVVFTAVCTVCFMYFLFFYLQLFLTVRVTSRHIW